ncbi:hypothetical protein GCM10009528_43670 [Kineococcus aurantiacus]
MVVHTRFAATSPSTNALRSRRRSGAGGVPGGVAGEVGRTAGVESCLALIVESFV